MTTPRLHSTTKHSSLSRKVGTSRHQRADQSKVYTMMQPNPHLLHMAAARSNQLMLQSLQQLETAAELLHHLPVLLQLLAVSRVLRSREVLKVHWQCC